MNLFSVFFLSCNSKVDEIDVANVNDAVCDEAVAEGGGIRGAE
jgi:hypothetical protein